MIRICQCCATVMICCSFGSDLEKVWVRFPAPGSVLDADSIYHSFPRKNCTKSFLFNARSSLFFQKVGLSFFDFLTFCITFYVGSRSKSGSGYKSSSGSKSGSGYAKAKSYSSCGPGSGSKTLGSATLPAASLDKVESVEFEGRQMQQC